MLALIRRGHTVAVVAPADGGRGGREVRHGIIVERVRYAPAGRENLAYTGTMMTATRSISGLLAFGTLVIHLARTAARVARAMSADLIYAHWWIPAGLSAWLVRRVRGRNAPRYAVTLHGTDVALLESSRPGRALARMVLRRAASVTAVSSYLADRAAALAGIERRAIAVCPMPVETAAFRPPAGETKTGNGVVTVGRLTAQKRISLLIEAVGILAAEGRPVPLTIAGDGPERASLERLARELGLRDLVRFTGQVEPRRIPEVLRDAAVFAFPAAGEGFGLAVVEALMLGLPVLAARDGGGVAEIVPVGKGGRLAEPDPRSFAEAITALLDDREAAQEAARAGAKLKQRLSPEAVARVIEGVFSHVA
jgi:glycosyltransferase involved in cell wall biosynthesis